MSGLGRQHEFLPLPSRDYLSDDDLGRNPVRPALDTLFSEFARRHRSLSPSTQSSARSAPGQHRQAQHFMQKPSNVDLRSLDYASEYDSHLMCPICHIPFVDPVVLDCDHTFCASCLSEYRRGTAHNGRSQCPSCRTLILTSPRKASRLIYNMCNDIKVRCPNEDCTISLARGHIERHATRDCPEQILACPDVRCEKQTKRKNYVPEQCVHSNRVECDCGMIIELGLRDWVRHKDETCPNTGTNCEACGQRISNKASSLKDHICRSSSDSEQCPGADYGCEDEVGSESLETHAATCPLARLAPYLKSQSQLLQAMQDQLTATKYRNENLEAELERVNSTITYQIQPRLDQIPHMRNSSDTDPDDHLHDHENDIEEIPRDNIPSAVGIHHRDLLLPAHVRDLTPSPDLLSTSTGPPYSHHFTQTQAHMNNHLLSLHEALRNTVSHLEADVNSLQHTVAELDARTSMQLMNETLRLREDLAHTHAALMSNRSQVQWLLNRERIGREQAILRNRGRAGEQVQQSQVPTSTEAEAEGSGTQHQPQAASDTFPFPSPAAGLTRTLSGSGGGSTASSAATSPMFSGVGLAGNPGSTRRPSIRGGSQERVKL